VKTLLHAGARVQQAFERKAWRFCFIGGVANFRWGTPRLTNDLDLTLLTGFGFEAAYVTALLADSTQIVLPDCAGSVQASRGAGVHPGGREGWALAPEGDQVVPGGRVGGYRPRLSATH
jgi:hypothetical protein